MSFRRVDIEATPNFNGEHIPDERYFVDTNEFSLEMIDRWQALYKCQHKFKPELNPDAKQTEILGDGFKPQPTNRVKLEQINPAGEIPEDTDEDIALAKQKIKKRINWIYYKSPKKSRSP